MYYPIVLKLAGRHVVVIGGGEVAEHKAHSLLEAGARVTIVSPEVTPGLGRLAAAGALSILEREYESTDIQNAFLVIAATDNSAVQARVWRDAQSNGVLINTVDDPDRCDFIMPSVIRRDDLIVAVSTSGKSPAFAAWLRKRLSEWITADLGRVVSVLGSVRDDVRTRFTTVSARKRAFEKVIDSGITQWIRDCDDGAATARVRNIIEGL